MALTLHMPAFQYPLYRIVLRFKRRQEFYEAINHVSVSALSDRSEVRDMSRHKPVTRQRFSIRSIGSF